MLRPHYTEITPRTGLWRLWHMFWFHLIWRINHWYLRLVFRLEVHGAENIPAEGAIILAINHLSFLDSLMVCAATERKVSYMIAREFYDKPIIGWVAKMLESVPVTRSGQDTSAVRGALRVLHAGGVLGAFPEGRISKDGQLQEAREGISLLAVRTHTPVVPMRLSGPAYDSKFFAVFLRPCRIHVDIGPPLHFDPKTYADRTALEGATQEIMDAIGRLAPPDSET